MKIRKSINWLVSCGLVAGVLGTINAQAQTVKEGKATVRYVSGTVQSTSPDGTVQPLKVGLVLKPGTVIQSDKDANSYADLFINERSSTIRVQPATTVKIDKLERVAGEDFQTQLDLKEGAILGSVKKLSKASRFDVKVPNGVAGVRGTDIHISSTKMPNGQFQTTFTSVRGEVVASARVPGSVTPETHVLQTGDSWTPGNAVVQIDIVEFRRIIDSIPLTAKDGDVDAPGHHDPVLRPVSPVIR